MSGAASGDGGERRQRLLQLASAGAFLTVAVVLVAIVISASSSSGGNPDEIVGVKEVESLLRGIPQSGLRLGARGLKTKLIEYGDLKCPHCAAFAKEQVAEFIENKVRTGEAQLEFRNLTIIDAESVPAAAAAIAAGEQGRGWQFIEIFYRNQGLEADHYVTDEFLTAVARAAGVPDIRRWNRERKSPQMEVLVTASTQEAHELGFEGTPSFAVKDVRTPTLEPKGFLETTGDLEAAVAAAN